MSIILKGDGILAFNYLKLVLDLCVSYLLLAYLKYLYGEIIILDYIEL
jgi:hypothetical protein